MGDQGEGRDDPRLLALQRAIVAEGWRWRLGKPIPYGVQLLVQDGAAEATLDFYPKRGRTVVGGTMGPLRQALTALTATPGSAPAAPARRQADTTPTPAAPATAEAGMDESGKGDWFGPLVVAAVYLEPAQATALQGAGVRDSKTVGAAGLAELAGRIISAVPAAARSVVVLDPLEYNRRYAAQPNINLLLAELYAEAATPLRRAGNLARIVCDQFAQRTERLDRAFAAAGLPRPIQMHHAESASVAVAAASVLASARFLAEMERLGALAGLGAPLPRGASDLRLLRRAARSIAAREGTDMLGRYAKLNFRPVQELIAQITGGGPAA